MKISSKIVVGALSLALALTVSSSVSAQTGSFADFINALIKAGVISADKAAAAQALVSATASASFTKDLTVGSSGSEVSALQSAIGVTPATGYFGSVTKAAVIKFQASKGLPATGYVGKLTRAALNGSAVVTTPVVTTPGVTGVVNSGVEGTLSVDKASISNSTVYEGESMKTIMSLKVQAKVSEINLQRVKLNLGDSTSFYTKIFKTIYVVDDSGKVLAQADLNSNTVVKDSSNYYITLGGFSYNIAKDSTKYLSIKADVYSSIKDADRNTARTITVPKDGLRGVDGAGIDQLSPSSELSQSVTLSTSLIDSASLDVSVNSANFKATDIVAKDGAANNEADKVSLLAFDLRANKADVNVTEIQVAVTGSVSHATTTTVYLYDGSDLIQSESVDLTTSSATNVIFTDIDNLTVAKDATKVLTIKADIRSADSTATDIKATVTKVVGENSAGSELTNKTTLASLSVSGENMTVRNIGPVFTISSLAMTPTGRVQNQAGTIATTTGTATFTVNVTALGGDIVFGSAASSTGLFGTNGSATTTTTWLSVYKGSSAYGSLSASDAAFAPGEVPVVEYTVPSSGVTVSGESFTLSKGNSVSIPVTVKIHAAGLTQNSYAVQVNGFRWYNSTVGYGNSTSMTNKSEWRTPSAQLP